MSSDLIGFDCITLKGDALERAIAALRVARQQAQLAYNETTSSRLEMVLADIEDEISVQIGRLRNAVDDDAADADASGEAEARRQAWLPLRAA